MAGIHRDLGEFWHHPVNAKRLVAQLARFNVLPRHMHKVHRFRPGYHICAHIRKIIRVHVTALAIRAGDFIPGIRSLLQHNDFRTLLIFAENGAGSTGTCAQAQRISAVGLHAIDNRAYTAAWSGDLARVYQLHPRRGGGGHRRAQDVPLSQALPFSILVDGVRKRQLPLAVERFRHCAGLR